MVFDSHVESMHRPVDDFKYNDAKGYFNIRIHTSESFFYMLQIATSEKGFVNRKYIYKDCSHKLISAYRKHFCACILLAVLIIIAFW